MRSSAAPVGGVPRREQGTASTLGRLAFENRGDRGARDSHRVLIRAARPSGQSLPVSQLPSTIVRRKASPASRCAADRLADLIPDRSRSVTQILRGTARSRTREKASKQALFALRARAAHHEREMRCAAERDAHRARRSFENGCDEQAMPQVIGALYRAATRTRQCRTSFRHNDVGSVVHRRTSRISRGRTTLLTISATRSSQRAIGDRHAR